MNNIIDNRMTPLKSIQNGKFFTGTICFFDKSGSLNDYFSNAQKKDTIFSVFSYYEENPILFVLRSKESEDCRLDKIAYSTDKFFVLDYKPVNKIQYILE